MSKQHISGQDFDVMIGDLLVHVESMSASITDNRQAVQTRGIPDGYVNGDVACTGDIEVDAKNFNLIIESAKNAGSFRDLKPFDIIAVAKTTDSQQKFELFGCLLKISDLLSIESKGADKSKNKIGFEVTSSDFVRINGVPYISDNDTRDL
jgi:hypothetical protein